MKVTKVVKHFLLRTKLYNFYLLKNNICDLSFTPKDAWPGDPVIGDQLVQGHYHLANEKIYSPENTLWQISNSNKFWLKEVHSFSWLRHLKARSGPLARKHAKYLILDWLNQYRSWNLQSWELEILSSRVSAWITNFDFLLAEKDKNFSETLLENLFKQIKHLRSQASISYFQSLKKDMGLELSSVKKIKILRGLFLSCICFDNENESFNKYSKILEQELEESFNNEGMHSSKSPSSQLTILGDLVTIREAMLSKQLNTPDFLELTINRSSHALRFFRKPNGSFATFNGSKKETKFLIDKILNLADGRARGKGPLNLSQSGFDKIVCQGTNIFVDTSCNNEKVLSKVPHAIEINIGKTKLLGSCGTIFEKNKDWKNSLLSASAHSVLVIENTDPQNSILENSPATYKRYQKNGSEVMYLSHSGYKNKFSAMCSRIIEVNKTGENIAVLDQIYSEKLLNFKIRMHLNPKLKVSLSLDKKTAIILFSDQGWKFKFQGNVKLALEPSIFVADDGMVKKTSQLILSGETINEKTEVLWGFTKGL